MAPKGKELQMRRLILAEHEANNDADRAVYNICKKLREDAIKLTKVKYWFRRFDKGNKSLTSESATTKKSSTDSLPQPLDISTASSGDNTNNNNPRKKLFELYQYYLGDDF